VLGVREGPGPGSTKEGVSQDEEEDVGVQPPGVDFPDHHVPCGGTTRAKGIPARCRCELGASLNYGNTNGYHMTKSRRDPLCGGTSSKKPEGKYSQSQSQIFPIASTMRRRKKRNTLENGMNKN